MFHLESRGAPRRSRLLTSLLVLAVCGILLGRAGAVGGQENPPAERPPSSDAESSVEDFSKPMGPPDPFNRGTPRGSMFGFIAASRAGDFERAAKFLDLRRLSDDAGDQGATLARQLKTVLDRKLWLDFALLSDSNAGQADDGLPLWQDGLGEIETAGGAVTLLLQRVPRAEDGVRIWKVSAHTVSRIPDLYQEFGPAWLETWLPPVFFESTFLRLALWQWLGLGLISTLGWLVSIALAGSLVRLLARIFIRQGGPLDERIVHVLRGPVGLAVTVIFFGVGRSLLSLAIPAEAALRRSERLVFLVASTWLVFRLIDIGVIVVRSRAVQRGNEGLVPVLQPLQLFTKIVVVVIGALGVLGTLGIDVTAAVAGLGVGGIAVAFAAQKTLENLFGGITLFADRPVRVGDFFRYGSEVGTVEEIGLRSTRVRTLDRTVVSIPNGEFANMALENYARRDRMRLWTTIGVRYETTPDQIRFLLARMREILLAHPRVTEDPARVRFVGFGAYSLDLEVFAYIDTPDWGEFLAIREDIYLRFMAAVNEAGSGFAFPSSTMYLGRDEGLDAERADRAQVEVDNWRRQGRLPFPHFPAEFREAHRDSLEWPPPGSPEGPPAR